MENFDRKKHWENIYTGKAPEECSWYQPTPVTSLSFIKKYSSSKNSKLIDIGGGDSFLADHLLEEGFTNLSVLDISAVAIEKAKKRLQEGGQAVKWIVSDVTEFSPSEKYDIWHDRAAFHFLTQVQDIENYKQTVKKSLNPNGILIIGTFSERGPKKCSGIDITQYSAKDLCSLFETDFECLECVNADHETPFQTVQNFTFCCFRKKSA